jgi:hypothetical protein
MKLATKFIIFLFPVFLTGCDSYYHYGLNSSKAVLSQEDQFYITGDSEFKSVLFISNDKNLVIYIQHPLHPIPEPEKFISQIEFNLINPELGSFQVNAIEFSHQNSKGAVIEPEEDLKISDSFYVLKYPKTKLPSEIKEVINIRFTYNGKKSRVSFNETVEKVKRWSKLSVLLKS